MHAAAKHVLCCLLLALDLTFSACSTAQPEPRQATTDQASVDQYAGELLQLAEAGHTVLKVKNY